MGLEVVDSMLPYFWWYIFMFWKFTQILWSI